MPNYKINELIHASSGNVADLMSKMETFVAQLERLLAFQKSSKKGSGREFFEKTTKGTSIQQAKDSLVEGLSHVEKEGKQLKNLGGDSTIRQRWVTEPTDSNDQPTRPATKPTSHSHG